MNVVKWMNPTVKHPCMDASNHSWPINRNKVSGKRGTVQIRSFNNRAMLRANPQLSESVDEISIANLCCEHTNILIH